MFSQIQNKRPKVSPPQSQAPLNQQPIRRQVSMSTSSTTQPRSQIEAMPPFSFSQQSNSQQSQGERLHDPSRVHPMFFTNRMIKAPTGVAVGEGVGKGYVFEEGMRKEKEGHSRL